VPLFPPPPGPLPEILCQGTSKSTPKNDDSNMEEIMDILI